MRSGDIIHVQIHQTANFNSTLRRAQNKERQRRLKVS
uniref:Uncharacterized protein n=1 Tax=Rhizophora mucronata TaxID=61149 RepID=A0A2P2MNQ6_RHIMU